MINAVTNTSVVLLALQSCLITTQAMTAIAIAAWRVLTRHDGVPKHLQYRPCKGGGRQRRSLRQRDHQQAVRLPRLQRALQQQVDQPVARLGGNVVRPAAQKTVANFGVIPVSRSW